MLKCVLEEKYTVYSYTDRNRGRYRSFRVIALNTTIFNGSGFVDIEVEQTTTAVPEYLSYTMLCVVALSIPMVIVPALWAIVILIKNKELQTNNTTFLINLLFADVRNYIKQEGWQRFFRNKLNQL